MRLALLLLLTPSLALADVEIKDGNSSALLDLDANGSVKTVEGVSTRPTYTVSMGAQATTAAMTLSIEAPAATGFKLVRFCVSTSGATAAAKVDVVLQRRTTASSGGVACTNESTTVAGTGCAISKMDPADGNYGGVGRNAGTPGTAGAVLAQYGFTVPELGAGAADPMLTVPFCRDYSLHEGKLPTVAAGTGNGLTISVSAAGTGGLAAGAITAVIIAE